MTDGLPIYEPNPFSDLPIVAYRLSTTNTHLLQHRIGNFKLVTEVGQPLKPCVSKRMDIMQSILEGKR